MQSLDALLSGCLGHGGLCGRVRLQHCPDLLLQILQPPYSAISKLHADLSRAHADVHGPMLLWHKIVDKALCSVQLLAQGWCST